jgi:type II restriction/modification system DNA methylase subunit YeeA
MNPSEFVAKWRKSALTERAAAQQHFLDLCDLLRHPKPAEADPVGEWFTFEKGASKQGGGEGWADVWKRGFFGWEYKGKKKDLRAAYEQLLKYRESLENPPLLVVCDMDRIGVHTNFTNTAHQVHEIRLEELGDSRSLEILRAVFFSPEKLHPIKTALAITEEAARRVGSIAVTMRGRGLEAHAVARFLDRLVFCLFAEDVGLLPEKIFTRTVQNARQDPPRFSRQVGQLFEAMAHGGDYGPEEIRHFNGNLFTDAAVLELTEEEIEAVRLAAELDWSGVDPSVFGTLFERGLDPDKRSQLGAHYTSREDIETLVEPVVMQPLRREWEAARAEVEEILAAGKRSARQDADRRLHGFLERLAKVRVLDPACGSGNFLYVTLQKLKDLEKEVITFALRQGFSGFLPDVHPSQLYGIEVNSYAYDLAQMTVWIGYLQWMHANGFSPNEAPILRPLEANFRNMDAILDLSDPEHPREPEWPEVDFIVGNPPFLGTKKLRTELGDAYVNRLFALYRERIPNFSDLCCYWFEKARALIVADRCRRAGLIATQGIRGGLNREVLKRIQRDGAMFFGISDREWILDGANVHVSMVGFDDGTESIRSLDGSQVLVINSNLTSSTDVTTAKKLGGNAAVGFIADVKAGSFDLSDSDALAMLAEPNPTGKPTSDVLVPWVNGLDVLRRPRRNWIIDFGTDMPFDAAALYEIPFARIERDVYPARASVKRARYRDYWWLHAEPCAEMRRRTAPLSRFLVTPTVSKYRVFAWMQAPTLADHQLVVFARSDDYFQGILHSHVNEAWARAQGTQVRERESGFRYTPTSCFETFPFPGTTPEQETLIAAAAMELDRLRNNWLNPPEWTQEEVLEFPGSVDGPWARYVHEPDSRGIGTVRYPRLVPRHQTAAAMLRKRTLTNLYNERPTWLRNAHRKLDEAVFAAYGWPADLADEEILARLLALNLERAGRS